MNTIVLKDELIPVRIDSRNVNYYTELGFDCSERFIEVPANKVFSGGTQIVTKICTSCGKEKLLPRHKVTNGMCKKCVTTIRNKERADATKTTCPICGGKKSFQATICAKCVDMSGENNPMYGKKNIPATLPEAVEKRSGQNHWNWKGGESKDRSGKQVSWSRHVKEAYDYVCDCCGYARGLALEAHHFTFSEGKRHEDFCIDNGVALCSNCHKEFHKTYGFGNNTYEQYHQFKEAY